MPEVVLWENMVRDSYNPESKLYSSFTPHLLNAWFLFCQWETDGAKLSGVSKWNIICQLIAVESLLLSSAVLFVKLLFGFFPFSF